MNGAHTMIEQTYSAIVSGNSPHRVQGITHSNEHLFLLFMDFRVFMMMAQPLLRNLR